MGDKGERVGKWVARPFEFKTVLTAPVRVLEMWN